jgi:hypothetical protein
LFLLGKIYMPSNVAYQSDIDDNGTPTPAVVPYRLGISDGLQSWLATQHAHGGINFSYTGGLGGFDTAWQTQWGDQQHQGISQLGLLIKNCAKRFCIATQAQIIQIMVGEEIADPPNAAYGVVLKLDIPISEIHSLPLLLAISANNAEEYKELQEIDWQELIQDLLGKLDERVAALIDATKVNKQPIKIATASIYDLDLVQQSLGQGMAITPGALAGLPSVTKTTNKAQLQLVGAEKSLPGITAKIVTPNKTAPAAATLKAGISTKGAMASFASAARTEFARTTRPGVGAAILRSAALKQNSPTVTTAAVSYGTTVAQTTPKSTTPTQVNSTKVETASAQRGVVSETRAVSEIRATSAPTTAAPATAAPLQSTHVQPIMQTQTVTTATTSTAINPAALASVVVIAQAANTNTPVTYQAPQTNAVVAAMIGKIDPVAAVVSTYANIQVSAPGAVQQPLQQSQQTATNYTPPQTEAKSDGGTTASAPETAVAANPPETLKAESDGDYTKTQTDPGAKKEQDPTVITACPYCGGAGCTHCGAAATRGEDVKADNNPAPKLDI